MTHHLACSHADGFDTKLAVAHVEEVFQVGTQEVDHQGVVQSFRAIVLNLRDTDCTTKLQRETATG